MSFDLLAPRCAECERVLDGGRDLVNHGDMAFHAACAPACAICGQRLAAADAGWRCEAEVISQPWGYSLKPERFWCARCCGAWQTKREA